MLGIPTLGFFIDSAFAEFRLDRGRCSAAAVSLSAMAPDRICRIGSICLGLDGDRPGARCWGLYFPSTQKAYTKALVAMPMEPLMPATLQRLPIGIQTFSRIREGDFVYIDKTSMVADMVHGAGRYFLSRPRRFGKSLLVDTLRCLFQGRKALFTGLYIEDKWDWSVSYPVIRFDFANGMARSESELNDWLHQQLDENQALLQVSLPIHKNPAIRLARLIQQVVQQYGQSAVILIDEYDKPILDNIDQPEIAAHMRDGLKNLYSVLKGQDEHLRFIFMTGVTKFSKVSLFSGLNQMRDLTLSPAFSTLCGYTQTDLETRFAGHLKGVDWQQLKDWYNGYQFRGEAVYNPFDILLFISEGHQYRNYWFETGSPNFLIKLFQQRQFFLPNLEDIEVGEEILDSFDVDNISPITLLFQSGYLTIRESVMRFGGQPFYQLRVPNQEVRQSFAAQLAGSYSQQTAELRNKIQHQLFDALFSGDLSALEAHIKALFAGIPWRNFTQNELADSEGWYASVLYAFFSSLNARIIAEDISCHGQADMTIELGDYIYVMEIKRDNQADYQMQTPNPALEQIQARGYSQKYLASGKQVIELGLVFHTGSRNLVQMDGGRVV
jgi:hypothetical protein